MSEPGTKSRQAIAEEAAEWFVQLQEKPPPRFIKNRFTAWLTESPVHVEEYLAIAKVFGALQHVDPKGEIDVEALADETVVALHGEFDGLIQAVQEMVDGPTFTSEGEELGQQESAGDLAQGRRRSGSVRRRTGGGLLQQAGRARRAGRRIPWLTAAALVLGIGASALYIQGIGPETYSTRLGEQRSVVLEDGSMVSLNTSTSIEVAFNEETRQVHLIQGEALFDVEKDATRPFLVETSSAVIRVTGTQFNVYQQADGTAVTVLKGEVEVRPRKQTPTASATSRGVEGTESQAGDVAKLTVGHQAVVKSGSAEIQTISVSNLEPVTAWTARRLVFDSTLLSDIVQQFNRYNHKRLVLDDPSLASLELSGVFGSNDPESLVLFLQRIADVEVVTSSDGSEIRIHAANASR